MVVMDTEPKIEPKTYTLREYMLCRGLLSALGFTDWDSDPTLHS
ncbi:MAG: hypothetical protein JWN68_1027 [Nocardioides sp.]|jgi:hypothetical protein|nr:hypothetical protein [Nocardioides sp.]